MEIFLNVTSEFEAVFLVSGKFVESARRLAVRSDEAVYLTVLPLSAAYLPYTVKIAGGRGADGDLCRTARLGEREILVRLYPRYNYVYSAKAQDGERGTVPEFFARVKGGEIAYARKLMSEALSAAVTDGAIAAFFDGYDEIFAADGFVRERDCWFLLGDGAALFSFVMKNGLIDDIVERELPH